MDGLTDDVILSAATYLRPIDLVNLALSSRRFGGRRAAGSDRFSPSLAEEASRRRVMAHDNVDGDEIEDGESLLLRRREGESWMAVDQRLYRMSNSPFFDKLVSCGVSYVDMNPFHVQAETAPRSLIRRYYGGFHEEGESDEDDDIGLTRVGYSIAICKDVMGRGRHYVEFVLTRDGYVDCGILRPCKGWDTTNLLPIEDSIFVSHSRHVRDRGWGRGDLCYFGFSPNVARRANAVMGLDLDFAKGTLTGYEDGRFKFVTGGLRGPYCWVAGLHRSGAVRVRRAPVPRKSGEEMFLGDLNHM